MCGRFAVGDTRGDDWADWLGIDIDSPWPAPSWNVAPTQTAGIVGQGKRGRSLVQARWGLVPHWWKKPLAEFRATTFNARSEEAAEKPMFRDAWQRGRCLVPAIGYYEWSGKAGSKRAFFITLRGNAPGFCMAGLWALATIGGQKLLSFTVLICPAGAATRHLHPRSPVVLGEADWERWLTPNSDIADLMRPAADDRVELREVGSAVGNVRNNGADLIH
ncbi:MAG TPA: SOS response-associated peptidase [Thermohalobaculum sp.]|nr:SOS response-associated peptidase [Thermohalobaculum sp.]